jgi:PhoH-like ATPase
MKISLDTNILINDPSIVFKADHEFVISFTVLRELDKLKRNPDLKRAAQDAIKNIWAQVQSGNLKVLNVPTHLGDSPDECIIRDTLESPDTAILSDDIGARLIANVVGVPIYDLDTNQIDYTYTGYVQIDGNLLYERDCVAVQEMQLEEFNEVFEVSLHENEYCIVNRITGKYDIWVNHRGTVNRISQSNKPYGDAGITLQPMDAIQACVLDAVYRAPSPLVIIDGKLGTGKTLLTLMGALAATTGGVRNRQYYKILVTKPPVSINKNMYTGFKPGTSEDKMSGHLGGLKSNLKYLLDKRTPRQEKRKEEVAEDKLKSTEVWNDFFEVKEIDEIQGESIHESIFIVDEWQLLDEDSVKLILSRIAKGSKIILVGDTKGQTYGMNRAREGFKVLYKHFGTAPEFSYIKLENIYRSELAEFVARIFPD